MALIKITGNTNKISGALSRLQTLGKEPQEFLAALGLEMVDRTRQRINDGVTPEGSPFAPLNPLYASSKSSGDPILKRTGSLRNELTSTIQGNSLVWGLTMRTGRRQWTPWRHFSGGAWAGNVISIPTLIF